MFRVIKYTDVSSVMSMAEMVKFGDTSDEGTNIHVVYEQ